MAGASLLALIDDIASLLDDVAVMSKVAARKTAGVLGDDLALNAEQVTGFPAERELPVVWAVAKGSMLNKVILIAAALGISAVLPQAITYLLMLGGAYLCFEGFEKVVHRFIPHGELKKAQKKGQEIPHAASHAEPRIPEKKRVRGAVRTDFILSAEILIIALGTVSEASLTKQLLVLIVISVVVIVGVYGVVAAIVKLDDLGLWLTRTRGDAGWDRFKRWLGEAILDFAPLLLKTLSIVGTIAMFLVGGGIIAHGIPTIGHAFEAWAQPLAAVAGALGGLSKILLEGLLGVAVGAVLVGLFSAVQKLRSRFAESEPSSTV